MPQPSLFGRRLKQLREDRGWSQTDLEDRSKVSAVMISHFETGVRQSASADTLVKLANALQVSLDYLLGRTKEPAVSGPEVEALLRSLRGASASTIDAVVNVAKTLSEKDQERRDRR